MTMPNVQDYLVDDEEERRKRDALLGEATGFKLDTGSDQPPPAESGQPEQPPGQPPAPMPTPTGAGAVPPPPPPPPPTPEFTDLSGKTATFASEWLDQPNRYLSDLAQATRAESEARLKNQAETSLRGIDEWAASRGLTGSNLEGEERVRMGEGLQRATSEDERALLEMLANADVMDRQAAAENALRTSQYGETAGLDRYRAGLEGFQLGQQGRIAQADIDVRAAQIVEDARQANREIDFKTAQAQAERDLERERLAQERELETGRLGLTQQQLTQQESQFTRSLAEQQASRLQGYGITQQQLGLETQRLQQEAQLQGRSLDLTQAQNQAEINLRAQQLQQEAAAENRTLDLQAARDQASQEIQLAQLGISQRDLDLRAQQITQQAQLEGRSLDLQQARDLAAQALSREQMDFQLKLQTNDLTQREAEFARSYGLNERQFVAQQDQFTKQYGEQVAGRLQQDAQFQATLQQATARDAVDAGLRQKALDLQQQGLDADTAFKQASLAQEKELTTRAQDIQLEGINKEDAYRYAALEQDGRFRQTALDLQDKGLTLEDAYRYAELAYREDQQKIEWGYTDEEGVFHPGERQRQFDEEMDFRISQAKTDKERFEIMMDMWEKYYKAGGATSPTVGGTYTGTGETNTGNQPQYQE